MAQNNCELVIEIAQNSVRVRLVCGECVDSEDIGDMRNLSQSLLGAIDTLLARGGVSAQGVSVRVESSLAQESLSSRIARVTADVWNSGL